MKKRCVWRAEEDIIDQARTEIADYIEHYYHRHRSKIGYRTLTGGAAA